MSTSIYLQRSVVIHSRERDFKRFSKLASSEGGDSDTLSGNDWADCAYFRPVEAGASAPTIVARNCTCSQSTASPQDDRYLSPHPSGTSPGENSRGLSALGTPEFNIHVDCPSSAVSMPIQKRKAQWKALV